MSVQGCKYSFKSRVWAQVKSSWEPLAYLSFSSCLSHLKCKECSQQMVNISPPPPPPPGNPSQNHLLYFCLSALRTKRRKSEEMWKSTAVVRVRAGSDLFLIINVFYFLELLWRSSGHWAGKQKSPCGSSGKSGSLRRENTRCKTCVLEE